MAAETALPTGPNPRIDPPLQPENKRVLFIGAGIDLVLFGVSLFVGRSFILFLSGWVGITLIIYGLRPAWFAYHIDAQIIRQTPYQRRESIPKWVFVIIICLILAAASSGIYRWYAPQRPNILQAIYQVVLDLKKQRASSASVATAIPAPTPSVARAPAHPAIPRSNFPPNSAVASSAPNECQQMIEKCTNGQLADKAWDIHQHLLTIRQQWQADLEAQVKEEQFFSRDHNSGISVNERVDFNKKYVDVYLNKYAKEATDIRDEIGRRYPGTIETSGYESYENPTIMVQIEAIMRHLEECTVILRRHADET